MDNTQSTDKRDLGATVSSIFSTVFSPLLVPTYGVIAAMTLSFLSLLPVATRIGVASACFVITCVLPLLAIIGLWKFGAIKDPQLNNRTERAIPYIATFLCYIGCAFYLWKANAPSWLWALMAGGGLAVLICIGVNTRWKISAHMAAMGGLVALFFRMAADSLAVVSLNVWLIVVCILAGCVGSSRIYLQRHTLGQVLAGAAVGFFCVYILS